MSTRHVATAVLGLTLVLGACGGGSSGSKASTGTSAPPTTAVTTAAPTAAVRTDDLDAQLQAVDGDMSGAQQSVNHANDTSPERADD